MRWLAQKEHLRQDCLLIGPPGSAKRRVAKRWAALAEREGTQAEFRRRTEALRKRHRRKRLLIERLEGF